MKQPGKEKLLTYQSANQLFLLREHRLAYQSTEQKKKDVN